LPPTTMVVFRQRIHAHQPFKVAEDSLSNLPTHDRNPYGQIQSLIHHRCHECHCAGSLPAAVPTVRQQGLWCNEIRS
jgi:hypothetical protein